VRGSEIELSGLRGQVSSMDHVPPVQPGFGRLFLRALAASHTVIAKIDDRNTWRAVNLLVKRYCVAAGIEADPCADELFAAGDSDGYAI